MSRDDDIISIIQHASDADVFDGLCRRGAKPTLLKSGKVRVMFTLDDRPKERRPRRKPSKRTLDGMETYGWPI